MDFENSIQKLSLGLKINFSKNLTFEKNLINTSIVSQNIKNKFSTSEATLNVTLKTKYLTNISLTSVNPLNTVYYNINYITDFSNQNIRIYGVKRFFYLTFSANI